MQNISHSHSATETTNQEASKVLRNTYMLLGLTLAFSSLCTAVAMALNIGFNIGIVLTVSAMGIIMFVLPKTANSVNGIFVVFAFTGLIGAGLGPVINKYLSLANGTSIIMQALGGTAFIFIGLSAYVLTSRKSFSFLGGFIAAGMMLMIAVMIFLLGASFFGYAFSGLSLAFSAGIVLLMSCAILYQTGEIIHGGETNYLLATASLYLSIINIFTSLLHLIGATSDD